MESQEPSKGKDVTLSRLKEEAKALKKTSGITHTEALEQVAKLHGFPNWHTATKRLERGQEVPKAAPAKREPVPAKDASAPVASAEKPRKEGKGDANLTQEVLLLCQRHGISGSTLEDIAHAFAQGYLAGSIHPWNCDNEAMNMMSSPEGQSRKVGVLMLEALATAGYAGAAYNLAIEKIRGELTARDDAGVYRLLQLSLKGSPEPRLRGMVLNSLGECKIQGRGCKVDILGAAEHFEEALDLGVGAAGFSMGLIWDGRVKGGEMWNDPDRAAGYYALGADLGDLKCITNLGVMHYGENLTPSDAEHGRQLLTEANRLGDGVAGSALKTVGDARKRGGLAVSGMVAGGYRKQGSTPGQAPDAAVMKKIATALLSENYSVPKMKAGQEITEAAMKSCVDSGPRRWSERGDVECKLLDQLRTKYLIEFFVESSGSNRLAGEQLDFYLGQATTPNNRRRLIAEMNYQRNKAAKAA